MKITDAQISALECRGLDTPEPDELVLAQAWNGENALVVTAETRDALYAAITGAANAEGDNPNASAAGRMASRSLGTLARRVLRTVMT